MIKLNKQMFSFVRPIIFGLDPEVACQNLASSSKLNIIPENLKVVK